MAKTRKPLSVFYSYAHEDEKMRNQLGKYLALSKQQGLINDWYDRMISGGEEWEEKIDTHITTADIIILLISVDFISSPYCLGKELRIALGRHNDGTARVIPVIIRPIEWSRAPFAKLQALPKDGKPVTLWTNREVAWVDVANGIQKVAEELATALPGIKKLKTGSSPQIKKDIAQKPARHKKEIKSTGTLNRIIYDAQGTTDLHKKIARKEGEDPTGDKAVDETYESLGICYKFFMEVYNRNSIDGKGMPLKATVHYDKNFDNLFWMGKQIVCGDGGGGIFKRFTLSVEMIAKEYSMGLLQNITALDYWNQSGALFQSVSLIFASLVKQYKLNQTAKDADWLVGSGIFKKNNKDALYSLSNPGTAYNNQALGKDQQPGHMKKYVKIKDDSGGVHINSGIPNRAFYLCASEIGGYAWEKTGHIWYETIKDKRLKHDCNFQDFAQLTLQTTNRLYGNHGTESKAIKNGWAGVGIKL
jgi:Zn-dependent metalloprotease